MQRIILSSHLNVLASCGDREEICRLIGKKSRKYLFCCNNEIGVVGSFPLKYIAHSVDSGSGWEDDENDLVEMMEMKMDE